MPKTIKIPKINLLRIPIVMSSGQPQQVESKMEVEEHDEEKRTPKKRTTIKGSGAGPRSAKKKQPEADRKATPVKLRMPKSQQQIEVMGTDGKLYRVDAPSPEDMDVEEVEETQTEEVEKEEVVTPKKKRGQRGEQAGGVQPSRIQARRAVKLTAREKEMMKTAIAVPPALSQEQFLKYQAKHPAPALRTNLLPEVENLERSVAEGDLGRLGLSTDVY